MAIEKMKLLSLVGTLDEEHTILQELVLCENIHLNPEQTDVYDNNYIMHEYEALMPKGTSIPEEDCSVVESECQSMISEIEKIADNLQLTLELDKDDIRNYSRKQAFSDFEKINNRIGPNIEAINEKKKQIEQLKMLNQRFGYIKTNIDFAQLQSLNYFSYEIGTLSRENRVHIRKNYENISALVLEIGEIEASKEDIYLVFYLDNLEDETHKLLKSLNWNRLEIADGMAGDIETCKRENEAKITVLNKQIERLEKDIFESKESMTLLLNKIYTRVNLELRIIALKAQVFKGNNVFVLTAWVCAKECESLDESIAKVTDKYALITKAPEELDEEVSPPTLLKNNWLFRPFEMIVQLYGMPKYNEIDPTPFLAITFCLMFGIMFGDVGQGLVYLIAGVLLSKKMEVPGAILKRLGCSSIVFGFVYGSVFGLEDIPFIKEHAIVHGGPLNANNIMPILVVGIVFGVTVLTVSFLIGMINCFRRGDIEGAVFGKNGIAGYLFFMGLITTAMCLVKVIPVSVLVPISVMILMLIVMTLKQPLTHLVTGERPLIAGEKGSYFVESIFEGIETILSTLSNALSFIRVGAFALNHAGLFLAFLKMSEMMEGNVPVQFIILLIGNILILSLEGLVVFIQCLRLQYYEMFSKYFGGDGIAYKPLKVQ